MGAPSPTGAWAPAALGSVLILATLAYAGVLESGFPDFYHLSVQEDEYLEWASFWAFLAASALFVWGALRQYRTQGKVPWFLTGVALLTFFVAMEEISWGQRLLGYRPPVYFLQHNFQQELNLHNVVDTDYRKLALKAVILVYGVVLALVGLVPPARRWLWRLAVEPPPAALAPAFLGTYLTYEWYPWDFSGEWVELMLGLGFLFAGISALTRLAEQGGAGPARPRPVAAIALSWVAVLLLGCAVAWATDVIRGGNPAIVAAARAEAEALGRDLSRLGSACQGKRHINKRVFSYVEKYDEDDLLRGEFAALVAQGLPEERALYFLDPWNSPYWFQCTRDGRRQVAMVYSFGPNRRRESDDWEVLGDDVGAPVRE